MWPWSDQVSALTVITQNGFESVDVVPEFPVLVGFKKNYDKAFGFLMNAVSNYESAVKRSATC